MNFPVQYPAVIGTVATAEGLGLLGRAKLPADAIEVRVDALRGENVSVDQIEIALRQRRRPVLLTLRIAAEGGHVTWKVKERREIFLRLLPYVEAVDVELATAGAMAAVLAEARRTEKALVLSAHAIQRPALPAQVARWTAQFEREPGTILKVASQIKSWRDLQQLAALLVNDPDRPLAVMGVGPYATQSRSVLTALGSRLVYGYLDHPAAPGQPSAAEARKMVADLVLTR